MGLTVKEKRELELSINQYIERQRSEGNNANIDEFEAKNLGYTQSVIRKSFDRRTRRGELIQKDKFNWEIM